MTKDGDNGRYQPLASATALVTGAGRGLGRGIAVAQDPGQHGGTDLCGPSSPVAAWSSTAATPLSRSGGQAEFFVGAADVRLKALDRQIGISGDDGIEQSAMLGGDVARRLLLGRHRPTPIQLRAVA